MPREHKSKRKADADDMPAEWFEDLSDASLRDLAGLKTFERGQEYWRSDRVELVRDEGLSAFFEAQGTQRYQVRLYFEDPGLHTDCTCPHAQDGNFCKHMVAAALLWRSHLGGDDTAAPVSAPLAAAVSAPAKDATVTLARMAKAAQTRAATSQALQDFLQAQPAAALASRLWQRAKEDRDLMAEIKAWAASAQAAHDPKALRTAVDALLKISTRQFLEPREVRAWNDRVLKAAQLLRQALPGLAAEVRAIAESAMRQALGVEERAYDNPGEVDDAISVMMDVVVEALRAAPPPAAWADHLLQRMQGPGGYPWQHPRVLEAAGPDVARAYSRRLTERWAHVQAKQQPGKPLDTADMGIGGTVLRFDRERDQLRRWLIEDLQRQGDPLAVFEFMKRSAIGVTEHAALIRWCQAHGRPRDALQLAQAACKQFKDHPAVEDLLLEVYEQDGWDSEALAIRQRRFDKLPHPDHYLLLLKAAKAAKASQADMAKLRQQAYARVQVVEQEELARQLAAARKYGNFYGRPAQTALNVSWRTGLLLLDGELDQALALVQPPHGCEPRVLEALADGLPAQRDDEACALLKRCFDFQMPDAKSPYAEPLRLLRKSLKRLDSQQARAYLLSVGNTWKARRNFIAGLPRLQE